MLKIKLFSCWSCLVEKQTEQHNKEFQIQVLKILKFIYINLVDYYIEFLTDQQYFLIIIDDFIYYIWVWFLKNKNMQSVSAAVKKWKVYVENQFQCQIMWAQTDNEISKFKNQEWKKIVIQTDIQHESSLSFTHNQNEIAEQII